VAIQNFDVTKLNEQLKASDSRIIVLLRGNKLSVRGIFPPRTIPSSPKLLDHPCQQPKESWYQQKFSTGRTQNANNLKFIGSFCLEASRRLDNNTFNWLWFYETLGKNPYQSAKQSNQIAQPSAPATQQAQPSAKSTQNLTIAPKLYDHTAIFPGEFSKILELIKEDRLNGSQILEDTWHREYCVPYTKLLEWCSRHNLPITTQSIAEFLQQIPRGSRKRKRYYTSLRFLVNYLHLPTQYKNPAGILCNFDRLSSNYSTPVVDPELLPSDEVFIAHAKRLSREHPAWYPLYCYLLLYGLRNTEIQDLDFSRYPNMFVKRSKTRVQRYILPFKSQWVDELKLSSTIVLPVINRNTQYGFSHAVTTFFRDMDFGYTPLMMRHRFARCMAEHKFDPMLSAKMMGHSLQVHQNTYMKFVGLDSYYKALDIN